MPGCGRLRQRHLTAKLEIGWSESSAATSDRVHAGAWITTEGPIAPDRPCSRQLIVDAAAEEYRAETDFRRAAPAAAGRHAAQRLDNEG
jgi:hypothetical protein